MRGKPWSRDDINILRIETDNRVRRSLTAIKLGRSANAVKMKLHDLGLTFPEETGDQRNARAGGLQMPRKM